MRIKNYLAFSFSLLAIAASAQWSQWSTDPSQNNLISNAVFDQQEIRIVKDGKGGAIMAWEDFRANGTLGDIYAQRISFEGINKWTNNGVVICNNIYDQRNVSITETSDGGAIICWQDARTTANGLDIYAQRIDSNGVVKWTANGVNVCVKALDQADPKTVSDGQNGIYVVWKDSIAGVFDVYAQHIDSSGNQLWPANGLAICTSMDKQINPRVETDGNGGCIITWMDKRYGDYDVYAQRVNSAGALQWTATGVLVCASPFNQSNPKLDPDGSGGAIIAWQDNRNGNDYDVYAQRINSAGALQWASTGVSMCNLTLSSQSAVEICTKGGINGAIVAWKDDRGGTFSQVYMQRVDPSGAVQWATNGIQIGNGINPNLCEDGAGGVIATWQDSTSGNWNVYAQRIDAAGNKVWGSTPVDVGIATGGQVSPKNVSDGNGGSIFSFQDKRTGDLDAYAYHLYANGSPVGINEKAKENIFVSCYPNPASGNTVIENKKSKGNWNLDVYDLSGKKVLSEVVTDKTKFILDVSGLASGMYYIRVSDNVSAGTGKLIVE